MKKLILLATLLMAGCSTSNIYVIPPAGTGEINITVDQGRKGLDSVVPMDGVQANIPLQGGSVVNPVNSK